MDHVDTGLVERYLEHVRVEKRLAARTLELYSLDLRKLADNAEKAGVALTQVQTAHIRRWVAQMHGGGRSGRGIALILSGWRGFYAWLGREGLVTSNPVLDVKAPKAPKPLPKALSVDDAVQFAEFTQEDADPWLEARDAAIVELLYGCGLRVGELVGLDVLASREARGWIDLQAGEAHVLGKGSKRRSVPVGRQALAAVRHWLEARAAGLHAGEAALFTGRHGGRLSAQAIWQRLEAAQPARRPGYAGASAHAAPFICQPRAAIERRPAGGAGTAGAREHRHDPGLHPARFPAPGEGLRRRAPAGASGQEALGRWKPWVARRHCGRPREVEDGPLAVV